MSFYHKTVARGHPLGGILFFDNHFVSATILQQLNTPPKKVLCHQLPQMKIDFLSTTVRQPRA